MLASICEVLLYHMSNNMEALAVQPAISLMQDDQSTGYLGVKELCECCENLVYGMVHNQKGPHEDPRTNFYNVFDHENIRCALCLLLRKLERDTFNYTITAQHALVPRPNTLGELGFTGLSSLSKARDLSVLPLRYSVDYLAPCCGVTLRNSDSGENKIMLGSTNKAIDWCQIRAWLNYCLDEHSNNCMPRSSPDLTGLTVINCTTRTLVQLPTSSSSYITLSYVWGQEQSADSIETDVLPPLIEDSIEVAKALGVNYLWIDRYCVPQHNTPEKYRLIQMMGEIYAGSYATIVAASGESPLQGLPGVTHTRRAGYPIVNVKQYSITPVALTHLMQSHIENSTWSTRGWTFQEAILSHRRLVFTNYGVYFQCRAACFLESLRGPAREVVMNLSYPTPAFAQVGTSMRDLEAHISSYGLRKFSHDADVLTAFRGIQKTFLDAECHVSSFCGIPLDPREKAFKDSFTLGLLWESAATQAPYCAARRSNFPTWTWAGWRSGSAFRPTDDPTPDSNRLEVSTTDIMVIFADGTTLDCAHQFETIIEEEIKGNLPEFLLVNAWTFNIEWIRKGYYESGYHVTLLSDKLERKIKVELTVELSYEEGSWLEAPARGKCIVLREGNGTKYLLVRRSENGTHFERIGTAHRTWVWPAIFDKDGPDPIKEAVVWERTLLG